MLFPEPPLLPAMVPSSIQLDNIYCCDALDFLRSLPSNYIHMVITSPPYFRQRDYGYESQIGREETFDEFLRKLVQIFAELRRVLREDGVFWLNMGDSYVTNPSNGRGSNRWYNGGRPHLSGMDKTQAVSLPAKNKLLQPLRLAIALQDDGWYVRQDCIWRKTNALPESAADRPTTEHEYVFLLSKSPHYWYDEVATRSPAKAVSMVRQKRGRSDQTKHSAGAPGQARHTLVRPAERDPNRAVSLTRRQRTVWDIDEDEYAQFLQWKAQQQARRGDVQGTLLDLSTGQYGGQHFATFPEALVETALKAGCPPYVCADCGAPYQRGAVEEKQGTPPSFVHDKSPVRPVFVRVGSWQPGCACEAPLAAGVVLDPFMGSGTTAVVARRFERHFIGCDKLADYVDLARQRVQGDALLALPLFDQAAIQEA